MEVGVGRKVSVAEARQHLPEVIREAEAGSPVGITRRGRPVAFVVSAAWFERVQAEVVPFAAAYKRWREEFDVATLDLDPDEMFRDVREKGLGRDFTW